MSKIVIYSQDQHIGPYFESILTSLLDNDCEMIRDHALACSPAFQQEVSLMVVDCRDPDSSTLLSFLAEQDVSKPLFIIGDKEQLWQAKKEFKTRALQEYIPFDAGIDVIEKVLMKMLKTSARAQKKEMYCKVSLSFFQGSQEVFCDVYLKLKNNKYIKVFNRYDSVNQDDIDKYKLKNVHYLYVKERDFQYITKQLVKQLRNGVQLSTPGALITTDSAAINSVFSMRLQETVAESIKSIGLSEDAVEMTSMAIEATMQTLSNNSKLFDILQNALQGQNYISEHSFMLTYLAGAICKELGLSEDQLQSITVAAFFHDIALEDEHKAKIQAEHERDFERLGVHEQEEVIAHIEKAIDIVSEIDGVSADTLMIISQHHEFYDGNGFPRGIDFRKINLLSAIFNVCHELSLYIYESGSSSDNIQELVQEMSRRYIRGSYNKAVIALQKTLIKESARKQIAS